MSKFLYLGYILLFIALVIFITSSRISRQELKQQISNLSQETDMLKAEIKKQEQENDLLKNQLSNLQTEISNLQSNLTNTRSQLNDLQNRISKERITYPSYSDVQAFIEEDDTDKQKYISENYTFICTDFTNRFINNFLKQGFFSCEAILYFQENNSHSIVAINTTDKGLIFVDSQNDQVMTSLRVGDNYCSYINQVCDWKILSIKHCFQ